MDLTSPTIAALLGGKKDPIAHALNTFSFPPRSPVRFLSPGVAPACGTILHAIIDMEKSAPNGGFVWRILSCPAHVHASSDSTRACPPIGNRKCRNTFSVVVLSATGARAAAA